MVTTSCHAPHHPPHLLIKPLTTPLPPHTGAIYCKATDMKNKDNGRRVQQRLGPITTWNLNLKHTEQAPSVTITTAGATYLAVKPAQRYRSMHGHLVQQGAIAWEVLGCIDPARGGSVDTSLEAVIARLTRAGVCGFLWWWEGGGCSGGGCD